MKYTVEIVYSMSRRRVVSVFAAPCTSSIEQVRRCNYKKNNKKKKKTPVICGQFLRFFCIVHYKQIKKQTV